MDRVEITTIGIGILVGGEFVAGQVIHSAGFWLQLGGLATPVVLAGVIDAAIRRLAGKKVTG